MSRAPTRIMHPYAYEGWSEGEGITFGFAPALTLRHEIAGE